MFPFFITRANRFVNDQSRRFQAGHPGGRWRRDAEEARGPSRARSAGRGPARGAGTVREGGPLWGRSRAGPIG